jgi:hypothetical protein
VAHIAENQGFKYSNTSWRVVNSLSFLNIMSNFFVYCLTLQSFRQFLKLKSSELLVRCLRWYTRQRGSALQRRRAHPTQGREQTQNNQEAV